MQSGRSAEPLQLTPSPWCNVRVRRHSAVRASHNRTLPSELQLSTNLPSLEYRAWLTKDSWPLNSFRSRRDLRPYTRTRPSREQDRIWVPSRENWMAATDDVLSFGGTTQPNTKYRRCSWIGLATMLMSRTNTGTNELEPTGDGRGVRLWKLSEAGTSHQSPNLWG